MRVSWIVAAVLACGFLPVAGGVPAPPGVPAADASWESSILRELGAREFDITWQAGAPGEAPGAWQAPNRAHNLRTHFDANGIRVVPREAREPTWEWGLTLLRYGRPGAPLPVKPARVAPRDRRLEYDRGSIIEWYENDARGLEQGFTLLAPPHAGGAPSGALQIDLGLTGTLHPTFSADGQAIDFHDSTGIAVLRYAALKVVDARGRELPARLGGFVEAQAQGIRIIFEDRDAVYPITVDPLATAAAWIFDGNTEGDHVGYSVATAGDVNGDGYSDVIVGANEFDHGQEDEGKAFLFLGSPSGLTISPLWSVESNVAFKLLGSSVASAGDVNGDGYSDVIVGEQGRAYVYYGSPGGLPATPNWTGTDVPAQAGNYGLSCSTAGDVNGDGYADVIVGNSTYNGDQVSEGRVYVYLGSAAGLATSAAWVVDGNQAQTFFGWSVATAGDVNGDGYADVLVGAWQFNNGSAYTGRAFLYLGSASGPSTTPAWTRDGDQNFAFFGESVAGAGDVNGDGYADVLVGSPRIQNPGWGKVYLFLGSPAGLSTAAAWVAASDQLYTDEFGWQVATAGDVNGDGFADFLIGAPRWANGQPSEGRAFLYLGSASGLPTLAWITESNQNGGQYGQSVATAGDVNGDGYSDVVVGAIGYYNGVSYGGRAFLFLGSASGLVSAPGWSAESDQTGASFGCSLASAGDVNGDGYSDVVVGASLYDSGTADEGRAFVYLGSAAGLSASPAWTGGSGQAGARFGESVASAGDVNGDGYADVIVGADFFSSGQSGEGRAYLYLGSATGLAAAPAWTAESDQAGARFGISVGSAGDVNGDGYSDAVVGADLYDGAQTDGGRAYLYLGAPSGLAPSPAWTVDGAQAQARFAAAVASAGDVNRDGFTDVAIGAPLYSNGQTREGRAFVYHGSPAGLAASAAWTAESEQSDASFGGSVASAGDVNADGYSDLIVGADAYDNAQLNEGRAYLFLGSGAGLASTAAWTAESNQVEAHFGNSLASVGDVNRDGYSDVVVGDSLYDGRQPDGGRAYLYLGSALGLPLSAAWIAEGDQAGGSLGSSVASAGDVNGDGFSDLLLGASGYDNGVPDEGRASLYYGGGVDGLDRAPRQLRTNGVTPIALSGKSDSENAFRIATLGRTPAGRGRVRLEREVKALGSAFDGAGLVASPLVDTGAPGSSGSAASFNEVVAGLSEGTFYAWRVRSVSPDPFFPRSPWISLPGRNVTETKLRTSGCVDRDGDGYGALGDSSCASVAMDCNDLDAGSWQTPGEARGARFATKLALSWAAPTAPGAQVPLYDVLRSSDASSLFSTCVESDGADLTANDGANPGAGGAFFYLIRAQSNCPIGLGPLGTGSLGRPRTAIACP